MHTGEEEGGTLCTPPKDFEKLDHKNAIKNENRGHPLILCFLTNPKYPSQKNLETTVHL